MSTGYLAPRTPLITLLAGLSVAAVLFALSMAAPPAAPKPAAGAQVQAATATPAPAASGEPAAADTPAPIATEKLATRTVRLTLAGRGAEFGTIAVSIRDTVVIAYVCDGNRLEAWLNGTLDGDTIVLTNPKKPANKLTATLTGTTLAGSGTVAGKKLSFTINPVKKPSGLYRASATVRGATVKAGWIVLPDGTRVGGANRNGTPIAAPPLNLDADGTAGVTLDGTPTRAAGVDPDTGNGFTP